MKRLASARWAGKYGGMSTDIAGSVPLRESVAEEVRALLGRRNISKIELARRIERSHTYVWRRLSAATSKGLLMEDRFLFMSASVRRGGLAVKGRDPLPW